MIAKRIQSRAAKPRMARLIKYMVAAQGSLDPRSWARTADYMLDSGTSSRGEKVGGVRVTNCNTDDPAAATTLIECTQAANTRSKTDKTYHLVFSFPPGETPTLETLHKIEDELVASIGYADHQRISAVHIDTDHLHVHVAINKVHPTGFQNIEPYYDKKKLMETCERLEIEHGLIRTNHGLTGQRNKEEREAMNKPKLSAEVAQAEAHSGINSLISYTHPDIANAMHEAKTWHELHGILAKHGLQIKKRGAGLVIGTGEVWSKASDVDREFSLKKLTGRLGEFEKSAEAIAKPYEPKPRQNHPSSAALFGQYQRQRSKHKAVRDYGFKQVKYEGAVLEANLQKWKRAQRLLVKLAAKGPTRRAMLKMVRLQTEATRSLNHRTLESKRKKMIAETAMPSWVSWLAMRAENGDTESLDVLRSREEQEQMQGDCLTAPDAGMSFVARNMGPDIDQNGTVTYRAMDGGIVIDRANHVQCFRTTKGSAQLALDLAAKRFTGQPLIVEGQEQFKQDVARIAGIYGVNVRFADPEMEQARQAALPDKFKTDIRSKSPNNEAEI
jgi:relaxase-like protein/DNA relaxase TraI-like protein/conjugative element/phage-associated large polyvalent protein